MQEASDEVGAGLTSGPSLYGDLTTERPRRSQDLEESMIDMVEEEDNYRWGTLLCVRLFV